MGCASRLRALGLVSAVAVAGCSSLGGPRVEREPARLVGVTDRQAIEAVRPEWVEETVRAEPDAAAASELLSAAPAEIEIYFGTWCSDSRRELARFWRALDDQPAAPSFTVSYVAVERGKKEPRELLDGVDLLYVPTFVVSRDGREIGRVIEESSAGIESDLLDLLTGRARGWISARDDLEPPAGEKVP